MGGAMTTQDEINRLDLAYCKLTGRPIRIAAIISGREHGWMEFINAGYKLSDLEEVILWIKQGILAGKRYQGALKFRTLIANLDTFDDELATCHAEKRNAKPQPTSRERVLSQARPTVMESVSADVTAKPIGEYIAELRRAVG